MRKAGVAASIALFTALVSKAGTLDVHPLGPPFRARQVGSAPGSPQPLAHFDRIGDVRAGPVIDAVTGQIVEHPVRSRGDTVVYDNSLNYTGYCVSGAANTQMGDIARMVNGGTLRRIKLSVFNPDATNKLAAARVKIVFYDGATPIPNLLASFTTPVIDFAQMIWPDWPPYCVFLTLDTSRIDPPIMLPSLVFVGHVLEEITGTPSAPTRFGQAVSDPPLVGSSRDAFWDYTLDGTGAFTPNWYLGGNPRASFYYELEVDPVAQTPPPIYDNTLNSLNYSFGYPPEVMVADDLITLPTPPGQFLDRVDFSIYNGSTTETLTSANLDIVLRDWDLANCEYYPENALDHAVTIPLDDVPVNLPPGYTGLYYVAGLAPQGLSVSTDVLAGLRFRHLNPVTVERVGQAVYAPPVVGASEDLYWRAGWSGYIDAWYWFGGDPHAAFYWRLSTAGPSPCSMGGDMNCDGSVNSQDIDGFVYALFNLTAQYSTYLHSFPIYRPCEMSCGDFTGDAAVNSQDIDGFIAALF